jgi:dephospho-CoA kinase
MIKVGITGGIGSGKSIVCEVFRTLGIHVYVADFKAKALMNTDPLIKRALIARFGETLYTSGQINRKLLAGIIFEDKEALEFVNSIVHPAVAMDFNLWSNQFKNEPYVIEEAALLYESGAFKMMDKMITVYAPAELRINRVIERDSVTVFQVMQRIENQISDEEKVKLSDFIIANDNKHSILEQVLNLHNIFLSSHK